MIRGATDAMRAGATAALSCRGDDARARVRRSMTSEQPRSTDEPAMTTGRVEAQRTRESRKRRGRWIAAGAIGVIGAAVGIAWLATRGDEDENLAGLAKLVPVKDDEACEVGIPDACLRSAAKMMAGESPELASVLAKYQTACDRGFTEGCGQVAWMTLDGVGVQPDAAAAREVAEKACAAGNGLGCDVAGFIARHGIAGPIDHGTAHTRWQRGCDLGYASACVNSARTKLHGLGTARDPAKAAALYSQAASLSERACGPADPESCRVQGLLLYRGSAGPKDLPGGAALIQKACDLGAPEACGDIGRLYVLGLGLPKHPARGAAALRRGCERGSVASCNVLAEATHDGLLGGSPDPAAAHAIAKTTCDNHGARHCWLIGNFYELGAGVAKDIEVARAIHERACRAGDARSCAAAVKPALGQPQDSAKTLELTSRSCDLGLASGCAQVAKLAAEREDHAIAVANYRLACDLSDGELGCAELCKLEASLCER
jgi:TPR repeat protein